MPQMLAPRGLAFGLHSSAPFINTSRSMLVNKSAVLATGLLSIAVTAQAATHYRVEMIDVLPGFTATAAAAINDFGVVAGTISNARGGSDGRAFVWNPTSGVQTIGTLVEGQPWSGSIASGINNSGAVVGVSFVDVTRFVPFVWTPTTVEMVPIGIPSTSFKGNARGINDSGLVAGNVESATNVFGAFGSVQFANADPFNGLGMTVVPGGGGGEATAINNSGLVVGVVAGRAVVTDFYQPSPPGLPPPPLVLPTVLPTLGGGSVAEGVSNTGVVVGTSGTLTGEHAVVWRAVAGEGYVQCH